jgi:hypothetical protein
MVLGGWGVRVRDQGEAKEFGNPDDVCRPELQLNLDSCDQPPLNAAAL